MASPGRRPAGLYERLLSLPEHLVGEILDGELHATPRPRGPHIAAHSTEHSDSILTNDWRNAQRFVDEVNSSAVYVNASTRFTDGGQFGLGAEVAVSTQKLHARGPMGLEALTTYKWIGIGDGNVRE